MGAEVDLRDEGCRWELPHLVIGQRLGRHIGGAVRGLREEGAVIGRFLDGFDATLNGGSPAEVVSMVGSRGIVGSWVDGAEVWLGVEVHDTKSSTDAVQGSSLAVVGGHSDGSLLQHPTFSAFSIVNSKFD